VLFSLLLFPGFADYQGMGFRGDRRLKLRAEKGQQAGKGTALSSIKESLYSLTAGQVSPLEPQ